MQEKDSYFDPLYGLVIPRFDWVPAPRYLMRRSRVLHHLPEALANQSLLEVGCGSGAMLEDFRRKGYRCDAVEISEDALSMAKHVHAKNSEVTLHNQIPVQCGPAYDVLVSCEVLEHIEDDQAALTQWTQNLKSGGLAILAAPSDPKRFGANDVSVGHYRRYTHKQFRTLCENAGLEVVKFESYGYPLVRLTELARTRLKASNTHEKNTEMHTATTQSGVERSQEQKLFPIMDSIIGRWGFRFALGVQSLFLNREIGNGMLCIAHKK